jgi:hypothetical protein
MTQITITRRSCNWCNPFILSEKLFFKKFVVMLDDVLIGEIAADNTEVFSVTPGNHKLQLKQKMLFQQQQHKSTVLRSPVFPFTVNENENVTFSVRGGFGRSIIWVWLFSWLYMFMYPENFISIKQN